MKKIFTSLLLINLLLLVTSPVYAQSADVTKVQNFMKSVIQIMVTLAGIVASGFFVWGGFGYITSSGNPESLERSKRTILYSAIGLVIVLASFVLTNIISDLATTAFGSSQ